ncbi:hypothetical protein [Rivihabitans pingtungensis]|uniref:hypothetical protein n=1 Tax=Rivihabitans pingtungensis TaxID=1054498 RepID=UPI0023565057|nr:hypothetical protein [Rivihabitans pingtungensis]MCK6436742.1 hypothetical protein [Rivihabitans pingtungensis]
MSLPASSAPLLPDFPAALPASMDFAALLAEGVALTQAMSSDQWSDYNEHDPGLTMLEQLCYALTDLGLRGHYPVADLLADARGKIARDTLFTGNRILTTAPVTPEDVRKWLYDRVHGLKNVWLSPSEHTPGVVDVRVEKFKWGKDAQLVADVGRELRAVRPLGQDWGRITVLTPRALPLQGELTLSAGADADAVMGALLFALNLGLSPGPTPRAMDAELAAQLPPEARYNGPELGCGWIDDPSPANPVCRIALQDVVRIAQAVAGVASVRALRFVGGGDHFTLGIDEAPLVDLPADGQPWPFSVTSAAGGRLTLNRQRVEQYFLKRRAEAQAQETAVTLSTDEQAYRQLPDGRVLNVADYVSVQHQFPQAYGLGRYGLAEAFAWPEDAQLRPLNRQARVRQLRAYLLLFEQVLSNAFAQLAHARELFSLSDPGQSYFYQSLISKPPQPWDAPDTAAVLMPPPDNADPHWRYIVCVNLAGALILRSPRLPNHARAEDWLAEVRAACAAQGWRAHSEAEGWRLALYDARGRLLASGVATLASEAAAQALCNRLAAGPLESHVQRQGAQGLRVLDREQRVLLSACWAIDASARAERADALLFFGRHAHHYRQRRWPDGGWGLALCDANGEVLAVCPRRWPDSQAACRAAHELAHWLREIGCSCQPDAGWLQWLPEADPPVDSGDAAAHYLDALRRQTAAADPHPARRNQFLDHLLARFDERFDNALLASFDPRPAYVEGFLLELASWKTSLLASYPLWSARRGHGADYGMALAERMPFGSGLEHILFSRLGLGGWQKFVRHPRSRPPLALGRTPPSSAGPQLRFVSQDPQLLAMLLRYGGDRGRYQLGVSHCGCHHMLYFDTPDGAQLEILRGHSEAEMIDARERLLLWLRRDGPAWASVYADEGLYVLEHVLLRPQGAAATAWPADESLRLSVLLPDWPLRFCNPEFRRHVHTLACQFAPAHLALRCHWLDFAAMQAFEQRYADWADARRRACTDSSAEAMATLNACAQALRDWLAALPAA